MHKQNRFSNQINNFRKNFFEKDAWQGNHVVCGVDEVGRGCLAGPIVTAAVILPIGTNHRWIKDSKEMSPAQRKEASDWIIKHSFYGYGIVNHREIDTINIWHATLAAMRKALMHVLAISPKKPSCVLVDAMPLNLTNSAYADIPVNYFPFGETKSISIAAASIIAKVKRDSMMEHLAAFVPGYNLRQHKGYATPAHRQSIAAIQPSIIHRESFLRRLQIEQPATILQPELFDEQQSLF